MAVIYAYTKPLGFVKIPVDTLKEFKQTYKDHVLLKQEEWLEQRKAG